jgi:predicted HAD superfamily Cof-like phosphohydrolase
MVRSASGIVKRYLEMLDRQPRRGTTEADLAPLRRQIETIEEHIMLTADPLARVHMHQQIFDLRAKLDQVEKEEGDFEQIEEDFIAQVAQWAQRKGVTYAALRAAGVPAQVLHRAGMN